MQTVAVHRLATAPDLRRIWEDSPAGKTVYCCAAGYLACFWGGPGAVVYAEPTFETEGEARRACEDMRAAQQTVAPHERWARSRPQPGERVILRGEVIGRVDRVVGDWCLLRHDENDSGSAPFQWAHRQGVSDVYGWASKRTEDSIPCLQS